MKWRRLALAAAPIILCLIDAALTLGGQSAAYWSGIRSHVNELSPDMHRLLTVSPFAFLGGVLAWIALFTTYIFTMPRTIALAIALTITCGHTVGSATWIIWRKPHGYQWTMLGCLVVGILTTAAITLSEEKEALEPKRGFTVWQWILIVVGIAIPIYVFMIPH